MPNEPSDPACRRLKLARLVTVLGNIGSENVTVNALMMSEVVETSAGRVAPRTDGGTLSATVNVSRYRANRSRFVWLATWAKYSPRSATTKLKLALVDKTALVTPNRNREITAVSPAAERCMGR